MDQEKPIAGDTKTKRALGHVASGIGQISVGFLLIALIGSALGLTGDRAYDTFLSILIILMIILSLFLNRFTLARILRMKTVDSVIVAESLLAPVLPALIVAVVAASLIYHREIVWKQRNPLALSDSLIVNREYCTPAPIH